MLFVVLHIGLKWQNPHIITKQKRLLIVLPGTGWKCMLDCRISPSNMVTSSKERYQNKCNISFICSTFHSYDLYHLSMTVTCVHHRSNIAFKMPSFLNICWIKCFTDLRIFHLIHSSTSLCSIYGLYKLHIYIRHTNETHVTELLFLLSKMFLKV